MVLNIGGTGNGKPYCKYNAKADKWFVRGPENSDQEIARPTFVADLDNIATGWMRFREGQAPERVMDPDLQTAAPLPGEGFKRGFVLLAFSPKFFAGVAELAGTSIHLSNAIKEVYAEYESQKAANPRQLPVIACTGAQPMKDKYGTNYRPSFSIAKWVERPAELPNQSPVDPADLWKGAPATAAKPPAQHVPPPAAKPGPASAAAPAPADPMLQTEF